MLFHKGKPLQLALVVVVFLLQFFALELYFTVDQLLVNSSVWAKVLTQAGAAINFLIALLVLIGILIWPRIPGYFQNLLATHQEKTLLRAIFWQFLSYAGLFALTYVVFEKADWMAQFSSVFLLLWLMSIFSTAWLSLLCLAPREYWTEFYRQENTILWASLFAAAVIVFLSKKLQALWDEHFVAVTFDAARWLLSWFYPQERIYADVAERILGIEPFKVIVDSSCSGYEGIVLVLGFLLLYMSFFRKELRLPQALLILPLGVAAVWGFNVVRIGVLIGIGADLSPEIAIQGFHTHAGWVLFNLVALLLVWLLRSAPFFISDTASVEKRVEKVRVSESLGSSMLFPFVALLATVLLTGLFSSGFEWLYPVRVIIVGGVLVWLWPRLFSSGMERPQILTLLAGIFAFGLWLWAVPVDREINNTYNSILSAGLEPIIFAWLVMRTIGAVIIIPIAEELAFRGYLLSRLSGAALSMSSRLPVNWVALIVSSLAFGLLHGAWFAGALAGAVYAFVRYRSDSVLQAVYAHALTNGLVTIYAFFSGAWYLW